MNGKIIPILVVSLMALAVIGTCVNAGETARTYEKEITVDLLGTGYIAGTITNSSGSPVENAHVAAFVLGLMGEPAIAVASTATNGNYQLTVPAGRYNVVAFKLGEGVAVATPVVVESGRTTDLDLSLSGGIIPGAVQSSIFVSEYFAIQSTIQSQPLASVAIPEDIIEPAAVPAGTGTINGEITNQNGAPIAFVRVVAVGNPSDPNTQVGFTLTHILIGGKGYYSMSVPSGQYLFVRAGKLPLYLGAWAGPITVGEGETVTLDLSITYIGPETTEVTEIEATQQSTPSSPLSK